MPSTFVNVPPPSVPRVAGVPLLPPGPFVDVPPFLTSDDPLFNLSVNNVWGIFDGGGGSILAVDSVASIEYARDYRISDYPQERGAFESYNKVQTPYQAKVTFLVGPNRVEFLQEVEARLASLQFVTIVTPEISYPYANLTHYGYRRTVRNGVSLIAVDVWCEEVRVTATTQASTASTQSPNGSTTQQDGTVQTSQSGSSANEPPGGVVSSSWDGLTSSQQQTVTYTGNRMGASSATASPAASNGNTTVNFSQ